MANSILRHSNPSRPFCFPLHQNDSRALRFTALSCYFLNREWDAVSLKNKIRFSDSSKFTGQVLSINITYEHHKNFCFGFFLGN